MAFCSSLIKMVKPYWGSACQFAWSISFLLQHLFIRLPWYTCCFLRLLRPFQAVDSWAAGLFRRWVLWCSWSRRSNPRRTRRPCRIPALWSFVAGSWCPAAWRFQCGTFPSSLQSKSLSLVWWTCRTCRRKSRWNKGSWTESCPCPSTVPQFAMIPE